MRFVLNNAEVASERLDGETIVIHLNSGSYYSLRSTADEIWAHLIAGWTVDEISERFAGAHNNTQQDIGGQISTFVAYAQQEGLIVPGNEAQRQEITQIPQPATFNHPEFQKFTDMEELLLVDPIHEVSAAGWPEQSPSRK